MIVEDVMTTDVSTIKDSDNLVTAASMMLDLNVGALPVVNDRGALVGIITDRDITVRATAKGVDPFSGVVADYMTKNPMAITADADVEDAADTMADAQVRRLPVVQDGQLVGIVTLGDLAVDVGEEDMIAETLEEISEPLR
jgi:CBS domain-containing protein